MIYPQININGTSALELSQQQLAVIATADALLKALRAAAPHGRDYQTCPAGTYEKARAQHDRIIQAVVEVSDAAEMLALDIQEQAAARSRWQAPSWDSRSS